MYQCLFVFFSKANPFSGHTHAIVLELSNVVVFFNLLRQNMSLVCCVMLANERAIVPALREAE